MGCEVCEGFVMGYMRLSRLMCEEWFDKGGGKQYAGRVMGEV